LNHRNLLSPWSLLLQWDSLSQLSTKGFDGIT
jgi:hypothetical protein